MPKSFPNILSYEDYESLSEEESLMYSEAGEKLKEKMLRMAMYF